MFMKPLFYIYETHFDFMLIETNFAFFKLFNLMLFGLRIRIKESN